MNSQQKLVIVAQDRSRLQEIAGPIQQQFPEAELLQTSCGEFALEALRADGVDILVTAGGSVEMSAFLLVQRAKSMNPALPVIVVGHGCDQFRAFAAGANGFVHFNEEEKLIDAARRFLPDLAVARAA